jgi:hypothetical protein
MRAPSRPREASVVFGGGGGFEVCSSICAARSPGDSSLISPVAPIMRTAPSIERMCSGVVPQQPPTTRTPLFKSRRANTPKCSGLAT